MWTVAAFYHFHPLEEVESLQTQLGQYGSERQLLGTIIVAREGINATVAGSEEAIQGLLSLLQADGRFEGMAVKFSSVEFAPFKRFKVKHKQEIVTFRHPDADPSEVVGEYVEPQDWNALISAPEVITIDTRNDYEVQLGKFKGAVNPQTDDFVSFAQYVQESLAERKDQPIAMYCTGGIRCERATAFLLQQGFDKVYHLKGGILNYLEQVDPADSLWQGDCFVFDERVALDHALQPAGWQLAKDGKTPLKDTPT